MHYENEQPGQAPALGAQFEVVMNLLSGLVSKVGNIMPIFAQQLAEAGLLDFMSVPIAVSEGLINFFSEIDCQPTYFIGTKVNPVIVQVSVYACDDE